MVATVNVGNGPEFPGICSNGNALLAAGLTFKANTSGALACTLASGPTGSSGPVFTGGTLQIGGANIVSALPITLMSQGGTIDEATRGVGKESCPSGDGYPLVGGAGLVPHPFLIGFGTAGQGRSRQRFRQQGIRFRGRHHHPGMVGGIYPEMVREVPKAEPRFVR